MFHLKPPGDTIFFFFRLLQLYVILSKVTILFVLTYQCCVLLHTHFILYLFYNY